MGTVLARYRGMYSTKDGSAWGARVLVVDDDDDHRDLMVETLEDAGYGAVGFRFGPEAFQAMRDAPALVVADLPAQATREQEPLADLQAKVGVAVPVVFITAAFASMLKKVAAPVLSKPIDIEQLLSIVGQIVPNGSSRSAGERDSVRGEVPVGPDQWGAAPAAPCS